ncbi:transposase [Haploplasma modicum]|uniref:transposase n=1 Tax=Haploplasma modicum TaxID=2150 RepID=UPI00047B4F29|nr:transposase [Haploplasma modicum]
MWLTDEISPSHQAIGNFINKHLTTSLKDIFKELNEYIIKNDNVNTDIIYIDGTKIESVANKYTFIWRGAVEKFESKLHLKITKLIEKLNKEYNPSGISFNEYDLYELNYLESIKAFLDKQIGLLNPVFVYGSGKRKTLLQRFYEENLNYQKEVIKNLKSEFGIELRVQRSIQVEGAFGMIKENYGIRRFRRKGNLKVWLEMTLTAIGYNLLKFHNKRYRVTE